MLMIYKFFIAFLESIYLKYGYDSKVAVCIITVVQMQNMYSCVIILMLSYSYFDPGFGAPNGQ